MPPQARYPQATWRGDGQSGGSYTSGPWKVILHTTETRTIPGYQGGAVAPHVTYFPAGRYMVQHTSFLTASRALRNESGGVQTNRDSAIQLEIVCYSAKSIGDSVRGLWVGHLDDGHLQDIAAFLRWVSENFGVRLAYPGRQAYSYAEANRSGFRLTPEQWNSWDGVVAHQHVPENSHWDTGALNWGRLMSFATQGDNMALTAEEETFVKALYASAKAENSNGSSYGYLIRLVRAMREVADDLEAANL